MENNIMRYFVTAAVALLAFGLADSRPANAYWKCMGPEVACGSSASSAKATWKKGRKARVSKRYRKVSKRKRARRSITRTYGGGSTGIASYYWQGQKTASGARFNPNAMTAAHRTLPFGTRVRVTHLSTGRSVIVRINDRGPFIKGRIIDLSRGAARVLGITGAGLAKVSVSVLGRG
jgi:peptidoglycan lytic transglycosylase